MVRRSVFDKIFREMQQIHFRLDDLQKNLSGWSPTPLNIPEAKLIALSDHLRRTYMTVASAGECDAIKVSNLTGRCRALESNYLNQLCRMGWLNKRKVSKSTVFFLMREPKPLAQVIPKARTASKTSFEEFGNDFRKFFAEPNIGKTIRSDKGL
jgi:hypothetical protein